MQSNVGRVAAGIAVVAVAVVLFVVLQGGGEDDGADAGKDQASSKAKTEQGRQPNKPAIPTIVVKNGKPVGGIRKLAYAQGDEVRFKVSSDVGDEVHVHGYDLSKDVEAGGSVSFEFPANLEGIFEAELEGRHEQIAEIRVNP